jgi:hypothetical protein
VSPVRYELVYIPEDVILHSRSRENLKSYTLSLFNDIRDIKNAVFWDVTQCLL